MQTLRTISSDFIKVNSTNNINNCTKNNSEMPKTVLINGSGASNHNHNPIDHANELRKISQSCFVQETPTKVNKQNEITEKSTEIKNSTMEIVSDVLIITENSESRAEERLVEEDLSAVSLRPPEKKAKKVARAKSKPAAPPSLPVKVNRDECDWDSLFDDNGECLDPTLIDELTAAVGEVTIEQPKNEYKSNRHIEVSSDEFGHVIEIYNFPSDFKTSDLATVFSPWKNGGFELKWVDDTHCLGVFSSPVVGKYILLFIY